MSISGYDGLTGMTLADIKALILVLEEVADE